MSQDKRVFLDDHGGAIRLVSIHSSERPDRHLYNALFTELLSSTLRTCRSLRVRKI